MRGITRRLHRHIVGVQTARQLPVGNHLVKTVDNLGANIGKEVHNDRPSRVPARFITPEALVNHRFAPNTPRRVTEMRSRPLDQPCMFLQGKTVGHPGDVIGHDPRQIGLG